MDDKRCSRCDTVKPADAFYARNVFGLSPWCKACHSDYSRKRYRAAHPVGRQAYVIRLDCPGCNQTLTREAFYWDKRGYRSTVCRDCARQRAAARYAANSQKYQQQDKAYRLAQVLERKRA
jgi:hypothetical protein